MNKALLFATPYILKTALVTIMATCRRAKYGNEEVEILRKQNKPFIYSTWHENVTYAVYCLRSQNITAMISSSTDGEIIARTAKVFGNDSVRGSTSSKGSEVARNFVRSIKGGRLGFITPDGPRGPRHHLQSGLIKIAALSGCPIIPYHVESDSQWVASSWDHHKVPKFFTKVHEQFGEPIFINKTDLGEGEEKVREKIENAMIENMNLCLSRVKKNISP